MQAKRESREYTTPGKNILDGKQQKKATQTEQLPLQLFCVSIR